MQFVWFNDLLINLFSPVDLFESFSVFFLCICYYVLIVQLIRPVHLFVYYVSACICVYVIYLFIYLFIYFCCVQVKAEISEMFVNGMESGGSFEFLGNVCTTAAEAEHTSPIKTLFVEVSVNILKV